MFRRILSAALIALSVVTVIGCVDETAEINVNGGGGNGGFGNTFGKFPSKPVRMSAVSDNDQLMAAFSELSRINRNTILSLRPFPRNTDVGCIQYRLANNKTSAVMSAQYKCFYDDVRNQANPMVREERAIERYLASKSKSGLITRIAVVTRNGQSVTRLKSDPKTDLTGGIFERSLNMVFKKVNSTEMTMNYRALMRPTDRARGNGKGEWLLVQAINQLVDTPDYQSLEFPKGFKFQLMYEADPLVVKSSPRTILFKALTPITFSGDCPHPTGTFSYVVSRKETVLKKGEMKLTSEGFELDSDATTAVPWPEKCLDN